MFWHLHKLFRIWQLFFLLPNWIWIFEVICIITWDRMLGKLLLSIIIQWNEIEPAWTRFYIVLNTCSYFYVHSKWAHALKGLTYQLTLIYCHILSILNVYILYIVFSLFCMSFFTWRKKKNSYGSVSFSLLKNYQVATYCIKFYTCNECF